MTDQPRPEGDPIADPARTTVQGVAPVAPVVPVTPPQPSAGVTMDTTATPVATSPVGSPDAPGTPTGTGRSRGARWALAIGFVALVAVGTAAVALALTGASPSATVLGYVPSDSVMYGELRLDLPGDQRREVGEFLSKFPGFADQAALDTKLDEVLDRLISDGTGGEQTFSTNIKPWFDGEIAFAVGPLPLGSALEDPMAAAGSIRGLVLLSIKDEALARAWFDAVMTDVNAARSTEVYHDTVITTFADPALPSAQAAFALIDDKVAVAGDLTSVKAAIDTNGAGGLSATPEFEAAMGAADGDHLGFVFIDVRTLFERVAEWSESLPGDAAMPAFGASMAGLVPEWMAFRLRIEGDAIAMDAAYPHADSLPGADANEPNGVANHAPPTTVVLAAGADYGQSLRETIDLYRQDPSLKEVIEGIDGAAGVLGGLDPALSWIGDAGIVVNQSGDAVEGGLIVIPEDRAAGERVLTTLRSFLALGGAQGGITVRDEDYNGTTISVLSLGDLASLAGLAGALSGTPLPDGATEDLPAGTVEIAYAVTDDVLVIGSGPEFVKHVLDAGAGASLADDARFDGLLGRVGKANTGLTFIDIAAVRGMLEGVVASGSADDRAEYEESIKPFLTPFDAFIAANVREDDLDAQHSLITVK